MNDYDLNNLKYIMSLDEHQFDEWMMKVGDDDINYAIEIIQARRVEIALLEAELFDEVEDLSEANTILSKYTLKG